MFSMFAAAFSDTVSGTMKNTEWGMVGLGIILGAGFALIMGFLFHLLSEYWHKGTLSPLCHTAIERCIQNCVSLAQSCNGRKQSRQCHMLNAHEAGCQGPTAACT